MIEFIIEKQKKNKYWEKNIFIFIFTSEREISTCMVSPFLAMLVFGIFYPGDFLYFIDIKLIFYWLLKTGRVLRIVEGKCFHWIIWVIGNTYK